MAARLGHWYMLQWPHSDSMESDAFVIFSSIIRMVSTWFLLKVVCIAYGSSFLPFLTIASTSFTLKLDPNAFGSSFCVFILHNIDFVFTKIRLYCLKILIFALSIHFTDFIPKSDSNAFNTFLSVFILHNIDLVFAENGLQCLWQLYFAIYIHWTDFILTQIWLNAFSNFLLYNLHDIDLTFANMVCIAYGSSFLSFLTIVSTSFTLKLKSNAFRNYFLVFILHCIDHVFDQKVMLLKGFSALSIHFTDLILIQVRL